MKKYLNILFIIILTITALYFTLRNNYHEVIEQLLKANPLIILLTLFLIFFYYFLEGSTITIVTQMYHKSYKLIKGVQSAFIGIFVSSITPLASGSQIAQAYMLTKQGIPSSHAVGILLTNFIVYQMTLVIYGFIAIMFRFQYYMGHYSMYFFLVIIGFLLNTCLVAILFFASKSDKVHEFILNKVLKFFHKIRLVKDYTVSKNKFEIQINGFKEEFTRLSKDRRLFIKVALIQVLKLTILHCIPFLAAKALDPSISFNLLFDSITLSIFVFSILAVIPVPGDNGVSEAVYVLIFGALFNNVLASSSMIIWRFATYFWPVIIGGLVFIFNKDIRSMKKDLKSQETAELVIDNNIKI